MLAVKCSCDFTIRGDMAEEGIDALASAIDRAVRDLGLGWDGLTVIKRVG